LQPSSLLVSINVKRHLELKRGAENLLNQLFAVATESHN
jgi:hypothetical protein